MPGSGLGTGDTDANRTDVDCLESHGVEVRAGRWLSVPRTSKSWVQKPRVSLAKERIIRGVGTQGGSE